MVRHTGNLELTFRECTMNDYDWCYKLSEDNMRPYVEKYLGSWDSKFFTDNFKIERTRIIEMGIIPIGFYEIECQGKLGIVHGVQILPEYRGKGIGTKIMEAIESEFKAREVKTSRLRVFVDNPAKQLYLRLGYKEANHNDAYAKKGTVIMEKGIK